MINPWLFWTLIWVGCAIIGFLIGTLGGKFLIPQPLSFDQEPVGPDPEGWKFRKRLGRWDAYDPREEKWLGWSYHRREWAVRHAQTVDHFDRQVEAMDKDREVWMKDLRDRRPDQGV